MLAEALQSKNLKIMLFESNNLLDTQNAVNEWLNNSDVKIHDIKFKYCNTATSKDLVGPVVAKGIFVAIVYAEKPKTNGPMTPIKSLH